MEREERIKKKQAELFNIFKDFSEEELKIASDLIKQVAFMGVLLEDLQDDIQKNGTIETYTNGQNQSGRKQSSALKSYTALISKYAMIVNKLLKMVSSDGRETKSKPEMRTENVLNVHAMEKARQNELELAKKKKAQDAFFAALKRGEVRQEDFSEYVTRWNEEHNQIN